MLVVAGCGAAIFYEPLGDQMAHVYYTERGQISWISPVARALMKAKVGDTVEVRTPAGPEAIDVLEIEYRLPPDAE